MPIVKTLWKMHCFLFVGSAVALGMVHAAMGFSTWQVESLGNGLPQTVHHVIIRNSHQKPMVIASGTFMFIENQFAGRIARWNGEAWVPMMKGLGGHTRCMTVLPSDPSSLIVGGFFQTAIGGPRAALIARWSGEAWFSIGGDIGSCGSHKNSTGWCGNFANIQDVVEFDPDGSGPEVARLYATGTFPDGLSPNWGRFAWQVGSTWQVHPGTNNPYVHSLLVFNDGSGESLYGLAANPVFPLSRWNGVNWINVGFPTTMAAYCGVVHDDGNGDAICIGALSPAGHSIVERWDGTQWTQIPGDFNQAPLRLVSTTSTSRTTPPLLIAAGNFTQIGSTPVNRLALWNGSEWTQLADVDGTIRSISLDASGPRPLLLIGGDFLTVNGVTVNRIALLKGPSIADLNNDGFVNAADLGVLLGSWGNPGCAGGIPCPADLNNDGQVNAADLGILLGNWG